MGKRESTGSSTLESASIQDKVSSNMNTCLVELEKMTRSGQNVEGNNLVLICQGTGAAADKMLKRSSFWKQEDEVGQIWATSLPARSPAKWFFSAVCFPWCPFFTLVKFPVPSVSLHALPSGEDIAAPFLCLLAVLVAWKAVAACSSWRQSNSTSLQPPAAPC